MGTAAVTTPDPVFELLGVTEEQYHSETRNERAGYMLSGIFETDMRCVPELQYGYQPPADGQVGEQILRLDASIRVFTSRNLSYDGDSLNDFMGVSARFSSDQGLSLLLGIPVWIGSFANGTPGYNTHLPCRFRLGRIPHSRWKTGRSCTWQTARAAANSPLGRADQLEPGQQRRQDLVGRDGAARRGRHGVDASEWLHAVAATGDSNKSWCLTIREPLALRHFYVMHSVHDGEWRRLMGDNVQVHLSMPITDAELTASHNSGELVTALVFAGTVPYIWDGLARFLILRREGGGGARWERIGRLDLRMEE